VVSPSPSAALPAVLFKLIFLEHEPVATIYF
jgi:hypothetical protein